MKNADFTRVYEYQIGGFFQNGDVKWADLAKEMGYSSGEALRSQFKREKKKRGETSREQVPDNSNSGEKTQQEQPPQREQTNYKESDDSIHIICDSPRIRSKDDVIREFAIDTKVWKVKEFSIRTSEGYRKDRSVQWEVSDGVVLSGSVNDTGKMLIVPMVHTETKFVHREPDDIWTETYLNELFEKIKEKQYLPVKVEPSQYAKNGQCLVVPIADFHLGLLATKKTNNNEYNLEIAQNLYLETLYKIKERVMGMRFEEVVFVIGNDFLNSDNLSGTTSHGTPQDNVTFWYEIIDKAVELITVGINSLLEIAPVRVYNVVSNHDGHSMYGLMKVAEAKFENNKNVIVDTSSLPRKFHKFGKNIIALTHNMKIQKALESMTTEAKGDWTGCDHFIWILAHLHKAMKYESQGLVEIYRVPTISGFSRWSNENVFIQTEKKTQCFILDEEDGVIDTPFIVVR